MRLIDADVLFKDICDSINEMTKIGIMVNGEWLWAKLNDALENAPTIEPKKGRWIPHKEKSREYIGTVLVNVEYDYWFCDICGYRVEKGHPMYNFCPSCGTYMKEGEAE